jgi:IclR family KDG regulon transcriptional repressor
MDNPSSVKTIDRLVTILDCFSADHPTWSLGELSEHLRLPKSTLHRFLIALESYGVLYRAPDDRRWRLGYRLFAWGNLAAESTDLRRLAHPVVRDLSVATGETAVLTVYRDGEVVCLDKVETNQPVRVALEVGSRHPPHAGASSKVLMAFLPEEETERIIHQRGLPPLCRNTITDPEALRTELARIRLQGYAESQEETDLGPGAWPHLSATAQGR